MVTSIEPSKKLQYVLKLKHMILLSHPKSSGTCLKPADKSLGPLRKMILLFQLITIYHSSGQGAEVDIVYDIGIKLCKLKCAKRGGCLNIAYNIDKLECHLSHKTAVDWTRTDGYIPYSKQGNQIQAGACSILNCKSNTRCVDRRGGGAVCVDDLPQKVQRGDKMSTQPGRNSKLLNITQQDLKDKWTTRQFLLRFPIKSMTWSPLFPSDIYALKRVWGIDHIVLYNSHLKELKQDMLRAPFSTGSKNRLDTGRCLTNGNINCVYAFVPSYSYIELYCYREIKNPRTLELERSETVSTPSFAWYESIFACNGKFGIFVYLPQRNETKKYAVQADTFGYTFKEMTSVQGLESIQRLRWNNDGTFAVAVSDTTLYLMNYKEEVITKGKSKWKSNMPLLVANDRILVASHQSGFTGYFSFLKL